MNLTNHQSGSRKLVNVQAVCILHISRSFRSPHSVKRKSDTDYPRYLSYRTVLQHRPFILSQLNICVMHYSAFSHSRTVMSHNLQRQKVGHSSRGGEVHHATCQSKRVHYVSSEKQNGAFHRSRNNVGSGLKQVSLLSRDVALKHSSEIGLYQEGTFTSHCSGPLPTRKKVVKHLLFLFSHPVAVGKLMN